uniref:Ubiquitin-like domain-containing protein n=1 Tax=Globisporangium ultimum (strain ATCC 200006 / CBS 805.95 / DAOM BR144) TaxID=431595 RepID=K3X9T8_GLOUD
MTNSSFLHRCSAIRLLRSWLLIKRSKAEPIPRLVELAQGHDDRSDVNDVSSNSTRNRALKPDYDGNYPVLFRNLTNRKSFTLRLHGHSTIKNARNEVKQVLRSTTSKNAISDIELVWKGRIVQDSLTVEDLRLKEGDIVDVVVIEDHEQEEKKSEGDASHSSLLKKKQDSKTSEETSKAGKRFMSYDDFLAAAIREEDGATSQGASPRNRAPSSSSCPVLKNENYYTVPSYDSLQRLTDSELSQLEGFTVGCKGLGSVQWIGKTDVRHLNLDELVFFEKKEVIVYKDDDHKHELGTGLNKPAIVELLGIFPPRKSTSADAYKEKVKQRTNDIGATNAIFSSERAGILRKSAMCGSNAGVSNPKAVASFWNPDGLPSPSDEGYPTRADSSSIVEHAGESSFDLGFDEPEALAVPLKTSEVFPVDSALPLKPLGVDNDTMSALKGSKSTTYQMMLQVSGPKSTVVRNHVDAGMFMARSFRCSWGPNGELVNIGKLLSARNERFKERVAHRVCIEFPLKVSEEKKSLVKQGLELHYECSNRWRISGESKGLDFLAGEGTAAPSVCPSEYSLPSDDNLVRCLHKYVDYADTMVNKNPRSSFYQNSALLWRLVQALWGQEYGAAGSAGEFSRFYPLAARDDINESENLETFQTVDLRREAVSKWFEETLLSIYASGEATGEAESPSHGGVLRLICQHRIAEAAEMAMECGDFRLSTLISQALTYEGSDFRSLLLNQLSQWNEDGTIEYMEPELVLVYSLLAGSVEVFTAKEGKNMPWVVCLALFFWFNRGPATSLKSAVSAYMDAVTKSMASAPVSRFAEKKDDLLMEVMKLYIGDAVSLCNVLSPSGFMGGRFYHLDYELSWHLHSVLRAIGYKIDRKWESHIHQNFIRQLESMGMWEEAAYVALNISSPSERVDTCRGILFRNVDMLLGDAAKRESLCARLNIPPEWVSEALAIQAVSKNEYHEQIAHWMAAHRYEEAHLCLVTHVAPSCLFTGEKDMLFQLLSELEGGAMAISQWQSCVSGYAIGGGLLLEYLRLEKQDGLEVGREEEYLQRVLALSQQLSSIRDSSASNEKFDTIVKNEKLVARTSLASMIVSLATQAVQLQKILSYTQEQQGFSSPSNEAPLELRPEFLGNLSSLITGRETKFVESYRTTQLLNLCSTFLDWRSY